MLETDAYGLLKDGEWLEPEAAKDEVVKAYKAKAIKNIADSNEGDRYTIPENIERIPHE